MQALLVFGGSAALVAVLVLVALIMLLRRVVPPNRADVVVRRSGTKVYSGDPSLGEQLPGEGVPFQYAGATYWYVPRFVPRWGMHVRMMPLTMMEIQVVDQVTFAKDNPQFVCDLSLYCRIVNVPIAAARWHMDQPGFKQTVNQLAINALRVATAKFAIEDTIARRKDLQDSIKEDLTDDFSKWGVRLEAVAIVDIKDAPNKTPVQDIAKKKEAEISAESRKMVAIKTKEAEFVEAENWQIAETRKVEAQEKVGIRTQEKDAEIAKKQQFAATEQMQVKQIQDVRTAEIDKLSRIQQAEGDRQATIVRAQGTKQQYILEGDGEGQRAKFIGEGEAAAISAKGLAEGKAKEAVAKGMNVLAKAGKDYRMIDYLQAVQGEFAKAMQQADIKYISTQPPGRFLELFTPQGGASLGGALSAFGGTGGTEELAKMLQNLRESAPGLYNAVRTAMEDPGKGALEPEPEPEPEPESEPTASDIEEDAEWEETRGEE